jgi:hypothetical protein
VYCSCSSDSNGNSIGKISDLQQMLHRERCVLPAHAHAHVRISYRFARTLRGSVSACISVHSIALAHSMHIQFQLHCLLMSYYTCNTRKSSVQSRVLCYNTHATSTATASNRYTILTALQRILTYIAQHVIAVLVECIYCM